jgi:hypothetical protein
LVPADEPDPPAMEEIAKYFFSDPSRGEELAELRRSLKIFLGTNIGFTNSDSQPIMRLERRDAIGIHRRDGHIAVDLNLYDEKGQIIAQIENNAFFVNLEILSESTGPTSTA